jgi:putative heme-binding domain-containing protein
MLAALEKGLQDRPSGTEHGDGGTLFATLAAPARKPLRPSASVHALPAVLQQRLDALWQANPSDSVLIGVMARLSRPAAQEQALRLALQADTPVEIRLQLLQLLSEVGEPAHVAPLLELLCGKQAARTPQAVQLAALEALQRGEQKVIASSLVQAFPTMPDRLRARTAEILFSRKSWALRFLQAVDHGELPTETIRVEQLRLVALHQDKQLDQLVRKHWGNIQRGTAEEKLAEMRRLGNDLRDGSGNPAAGRELFAKHCATCHRLFEEGSILGPDLTHANRFDRDYLLVNIVDPSAVIRKEYLSYNVLTKDGRFLTGLIAEQNPAGLTLWGANNERTKIARDNLERLEESPVSLMPENLLKGLKPQELRDLFSYLQSPNSPSTGKK